MHMMIAGIVLHATVLGVLAFFILFAASKADGFVKLLGNILGVWVLLLALAATAFGVWTCIHGGPDRMHGGWMMWHDHMMPPPGMTPPASAPATNAPPAAAPAPATKH